jgi:hypothetical protein
MYCCQAALHAFPYQVRVGAHLGAYQFGGVRFAGASLAPRRRILISLFFELNLIPMAAMKLYLKKTYDIL